MESNCPVLSPGTGSACNGCDGQKLCSQSGNAVVVDEKLRTRLGAIKHPLLVLSGKGGVGKSTVAVNLARMLALEGKRVGILDVDICGPSCAKMLGVEGSDVVNTEYGWQPVKPEGFDGKLSVMSVAFLIGSKNDPVIWRGPRKTSMILNFLRDTFWSKLDYLVIDTPPGTSDEHLSVVTALKDAVTGCVMVTTAQEMSLQTIRKEMDFCKRVSLPVYGVIENMSGYACPCCNRYERIFGGKDDAVKKLCEKYGCPMLGVIPIDSGIGESAENGSNYEGECFKEVLKHIVDIVENDEDDD